MKRLIATILDKGNRDLVSLCLAGAKFYEDRIQIALCNGMLIELWIPAHTTKIFFMKNRYIQSDRDIDYFFSVSSRIEK